MMSHATQKKQQQNENIIMWLYTSLTHQQKATH